MNADLRSGLGLGPFSLLRFLSNWLFDFFVSRSLVVLRRGLLQLPRDQDQDRISRLLEGLPIGSVCRVAGFQVSAEGFYT